MLKKMPGESENATITHSEATKILDVAFHNIKVQEDATASGMLLFKRWHDRQH